MNQKINFHYLKNGKLLVSGAAVHSTKDKLFIIYKRTNKIYRVSYVMGGVSRSVLRLFRRMTTHIPCHYCNFNWFHSLFERTYNNKENKET